MKARKLIALTTLAIGLLGAGSIADAKPQLCVSVRTPSYVPTPGSLGSPDVSIPQVDLGEQCQPLP